MIQSIKRGEDEAVFGSLQPGQITKYVIGAVVALILGAQVIFNGFFLSLRGLGVRRGDDETPPSDELNSCSR